MNNIKQIIVVRTDLNMRKGKMCAQVAHASMKVFFDRMSTERNEFPVFQLDEEQKQSNSYIMKPFVTKKIMFYDNEPMLQWMEGFFTKIVVGCNSEHELFDLQKQADEADIVNAIILDNGNTEFKQDCFACNGGGKNTGKIRPRYLGESCRKCNGTGKINKPTYTCLAIGPDLSEKIDVITKGLKLL